MKNDTVKKSLLTFEDARTRILDTPFKTLTTETVLLAHAQNRILANDIFSDKNIPAFSNAAMDGYAIRLIDLQHHNFLLPIAGKIFAGDRTLPDWPQGTCLRIMTGAPIPKDADAVIMQEQTQLLENGVLFNSLVQKNDNIRFAGEDIKRGDKIINAGSRLTTPVLLSIAALGINIVTVYRPLVIALLSTGNELKEIGESLENHQIYDTNRFALTLILMQLGCKIIDLGIIADDPQKITQAFTFAKNNADLIISSGGVSVGEADYTQKVLTEMGHINFWKLAMKPGKPFAFGQIDHVLFCGLPGNPVSAITTFYQLVQPLIIKLSGVTPLPQSLQFQVKTITPLKKTPGRLDFQRGILITESTGELVVKSTGQQGSHLLHSIYQANCFILLEKDRHDVKAGEYVTVEPFNSLLGPLL